MSKLSEAKPGVAVARSDRAHEPEYFMHGVVPSETGAATAIDAFAQTGLRQQAIGFLRGEDNPFDAFVAAESADNDFFKFHAPEIHAAAFDRIAAAIAKLGRPDFPHRPKLHPTRVLVVRGARGAGKTHLLHAVQYRPGGGHDLLIRPRYFESHPTFAEFLLKELLRSLLARDDNEPPSPLGWIAARLAHKMLREAVAALTPGEWLQWTCRPTVLGILVGKRWSRELAAQDKLLTELAATTLDRPIAELCAAHGLTPDAVQRVLDRHITRCDVGARPAMRMKRRVLSSLAELALTGNRDAFASFVEHEFAEVDQGLPPTRAELVDDLLRTLVELLAAAEIPVLLAFDNIERLLGSRGRLNVELAQSFFSGLAQVIDSVPGILVLLFVEGGLWIECTQVAIDSFAHDRLMQGIRVRDYGNVSQLELTPPSLDELEHLVRRRLRPLLARTGVAEKLPDLFPFERSDLQRIARFENDVFRAALMRLRDRYDELVLPSSPSAEESLPELPEPPKRVLSQVQLERESLLPKWDSAVTRARREWASAARGTLTDKLHAGLGRWLDTFANTELAGDARLVRVEPNFTFGDHPTYGVVTVAHWRSTISADRERRVAIGVVLGQAAAMPKDLGVKLSVFDLRPAPADELIVLWPDREWNFDAAALPPASLQVWNKAAGRRPRLVGLPTQELAWLLAFSDWLSELRETESAQEEGWPQGAVETFVRERTARLLERLMPSPQIQETQR
jgi:hypothetical protein